MEEVTNPLDHSVTCHNVLNTFTSMCQLIPLFYELDFNYFLIRPSMVLYFVQYYAAVKYLHFN
jgi:hypothetical protein